MNSITSRGMAKKEGANRGYDEVHLLNLEELIPFENRIPVPQDWILEISRNFDPLLYKPIRVCSLIVSGKTSLHIADGHARWEAAKKMGLKQIRAHIFDVESEKEVADFYFQIVEYEAQFYDEDEDEDD